MAKLRNYPPEHGIRVPAAELEEIVHGILLSAGMSDEDARLVAGLLVANDQRCVFSHGTRKLEDYVARMRDGGVNPRPQVRVERDEGSVAVIDGDGGLGHLACHVGMGLAIDKARTHGVGAATTYNHYHFGSAGKWSRMALAHDCIGLAVSTHRFRPNPDGVVTGAVGSSPISIALPAGAQPPMVLDMGGMGLSRSPELMEQMPLVFFKALGLGTVNVMLGGLLAGIWRPEIQAPASKWVSNQGSFLTAWSVAHFRDVEDFKREMDDWIAEVRRMKPVPGFDRAELPGGMEWAWERDNAERGIPVTDDHRQRLEAWAAEAGLDVSLEAFAGTRF